MGLLSHLKRKPTPLPVPVPPNFVILQNGRRHRTDIPYLLPKDFPEADRLNFQHVFLRHITGKNSFAPISEPPVNVLDVGAGTARWGIEMAQQFPTTQVINVDIEFHLPAVAIPANCQFIVGNVLDRLPFPDQHFSFVHQRFLGSAIPLIQWPHAVSELVRVVRSGGWVELFEAGNGFTNQGEATRLFLSWWNLMGQQRGIDTTKLPAIGVWLKKAGLHHVETQTIRVPIGLWGDRAGTALMKMCLSGWGSLKWSLCSQLNMNPDFFDATLAKLPFEWDARRCEYEYYIAFGQR